MNLKNQEKCITCTNKAHARGPCTTCYHSAKEFVGRNEVTWEQLEKLGLCIPKIRTMTPFYRALQEKLNTTQH